MKPIRLGLIGCGMIVGHHIRSYEEVYGKIPGLFEVAAASDLDLERAEDIAAKIGSFQARKPTVYTDYQEMLEKEELDAVSVATPHFAHHQPSIDALNKGLNVVVEKPFAITIKAGLKMLDAAKKNNKILACAEPMRRSAGNRTIDWAINRAKLIGEPRFFFYQRAMFSLGVVVGTPWRHQKLMSGGGWVHDGEVHYIDFLRMVFGDVAEVYAKIRNFEPTRYLDIQNRKNPVPSDVEDTAFAILTFESGLLASFTWTHAATGKPLDVVRYYGSEGSLDNEGVLSKGGEHTPMPELETRFMESITVEEKEKIFPHGMTNPSAIAFHNFFDSIRTGEKPEISGEDAFAAQAICEAVYESDACGQAVRMEDVISGRWNAFQRDIDKRWNI